MCECVKQQETRGDDDFGVKSQAGGSKAALEVTCTLAEGRGGFLSTQQIFVQAEKHAFPIEFECGEPRALANDVWQHQGSTHALETFQHHDFLEAVDGDELAHRCDDPSWFCAS